MTVPPAAATFVGPDVDWFALVAAARPRSAAALVLLLVGALTPTWPRGLYAWFTVAIGARRRSCWPSSQWDDITDDGAEARSSAARSRSTRSRCSSRSRSASALIRVALVTDDYLRREGIDGPEVYGLYLMAAIGGVVMGVGQRPDRAVPRPRDAVDRALRARRQPPPPDRRARRAASSTSCSAGSRRRSSSTASPSIYGGTGIDQHLDEIVAAFDNAIPVDRNDALVLAGVALLHRRARVQGRGRAVPLLDARRVRGRARRRSPRSWRRSARSAAFAAMLRVLVVGLPNWTATTGAR